SGEARAGLLRAPKRSASAATASNWPCWARSPSISQTGLRARTAARRAYSRATVETPSPVVAATKATTRPRWAGAGPSAAHSPAISDVRSTIESRRALPLSFRLARAGPARAGSVRLHRGDGQHRHVQGAADDLGRGEAAPAENA